MHERRRHARQEVCTPVEIHSVRYGVIRGVATNVSEGGVMVRTYDRIPIGEKVVVKFGDEVSVLVEGVVRSHAYLDYQGEGSVGGFSGMGVRFTGRMVDEESRNVD